MENCNIAAIDIGSNGARLLIKNVVEDAGGNCEFSKVLFLRIPLRLGKDVFTIGKITPERERMMMCMIKSFKQLMKLYNVVAYRACATSAMRDADNGKKVIKRIRRKTGIGIEIIPGGEEARLLCDNSMELGYARNGNYVYVDVGGGSTEISIISDGRMVDSRSYNIGTLRILGGAVEEGTVDTMRSELASYAACPGMSIIGSGGNINKLCRIYGGGKGKKDKGTLPVEGLRKIYGDMKGMTYRERIDRYSLKPDRADVIIPAAELFLTVADALGCEIVHVPNISLADCIIDRLYKKLRGEAAVV